MLILGNLIALIGSILMLITGILKEKKKILITQSLQISSFIISNAVLGGFTGVIINSLSLIRNIICYKEKFNTLLKIIFTILSIILCLKFNNLGLIGLLPLLSNIIYLWFMDTKNINKFKLLLAFTMLIWAIYDFKIKSYTAFIFDFGCLIANIVTIKKI